MKPISINHADNPHYVAHTVFEAMQAVQQMHEQSAQGPVCASIGLVDHPYSTVLEIGVCGDVGFVRFLSLSGGTEAWAPGINENRGEVRTYYFQEDGVEVPTRNEVPFEVVQLAVIDYMVHNGQQPTATLTTPEYA